MVQLPAIQMLRAAAVLAVVAGHLPHWGNAWVPAGVDLFFAISGFIIVYVSAGTFGTPGAVVDFIRRRIIRIVPLYWLTTLAFLFLLPHSEGGADIVQSLLFLPSPNGRLPILPPGWTLNYEMFFYAIFATVLWLPYRKAIGLLCSVLFAIVVITSLLGVNHTLPRGFNPIISEFCLGALIGMAHLGGVRFSRRVAMALTIAAIGILVAAGFLINWLSPLRPLAWGVPTAAIVAAVALTREQWTPPGTVVFIGDASYAIYLTHWIVIAMMKGSSDFATFAACIAVGLAVHVTIEKPITTWLKRVRIGARLRQQSEVNKLAQTA